MLKIKNQRLEILGIEVLASIGVYDFEKKSKKKFVVDLSIWGSFKTAMNSDRIEDTLDYQEVYQIVQEVLQEDYHLIEHACYTLTMRLSGISFPMTKLSVRLSKLEPPVGGKLERTSFTITCKPDTSNN